MKTGKPRVLLVQQEWTNWGQSRSWGYGAHLGLEHGLADNGIDSFTITSVWAADVMKTLSGQKFDQIWFNDLAHLELPDGWWEWAATLAPVRLGWLVESAHYTAEEIEIMPSVGQERQARLEERARYCTHLACCDENDVQNGPWPRKPSLWVPFAVPKQFIRPVQVIPARGAVTFCGTLYGNRARWLAGDLLASRMTRQTALEEKTLYPRMFDWLHRARPALKFLPAGSGFKIYLRFLRLLRRRMYVLWLEGMRQGRAVVNLPHLVKTYTPRVVEGMAAGVPVISWEIPERPRNRALFEDGVDILLFNRDSVEELAGQIDRIDRDPVFAKRMATNAHHKLLQNHTIERRVKEVLAWIGESQG
jgi:hypothetical protein